MSGYPSITFHNPTSIYGREKWDGFRNEGFSTDIIAKVETWFPERETDREYNNDYRSFLCNRLQRRSRNQSQNNRGGCALWLNKKTCTETKREFRSYGDEGIPIQALCVTFKYQRQYFAVLIIYSPPGRSLIGRSNKNTKLVQNMLKRGRNSNIPKDNYIVMGDFNRSTLGTERQLGVKFHLYAQGVSKLDQIYGTNKSIPYNVATPRDPEKYNLDHQTETKERHRILEIKAKSPEE